MQGQWDPMPLHESVLILRNCLASENVAEVTFGGYVVRNLGATARSLRIPRGHSPHPRGLHMEQESLLQEP